MERLYEWLFIYNDDTTEKIKAVDIETALDKSNNYGREIIACVRGRRLFKEK